MRTTRRLRSTRRLSRSRRKRLCRTSPCSDRNEELAMEPDDRRVIPILLASPREPSGVSWLINCFLELGIKVSLKPTIERIGAAPTEGVEASGMWVAEAGGRWRL